MTNTINQPNLGENRVDMWRFPAGFDEVGAKIAETQQRNYTNFIAGNEPQSAEHGQPPSTVPEVEAVNQYETIPAPDQHVDQTGKPIGPATAEDVLAQANHVLSEALAAAPEAQAAHLSKEHHRQANQQAAEYGPRIEMLREQALKVEGSQGSYELAA